MRSHRVRHDWSDLAIAKIAVNIGIHISFWNIVFFFSRYGIGIPGVGLPYHMIVPFLVFKEISILFFHNSHTNLYLLEQWRKIFFSPHALQNLFIDFLMMVILTSVRWYLMGIWICMPLSETLRIFLCACWPFVCLLWKKHLFKSSAHLLMSCFFF